MKSPKKNPENFFRFNSMRFIVLQISILAKNNIHFHNLCLKALMTFKINFKKQYFNQSLKFVAPFEIIQIL